VNNKRRIIPAILFLAVALIICIIITIQDSDAYTGIQLSQASALSGLASAASISKTVSAVLTPQKQVEDYQKSHTEYQYADTAFFTQSASEDSIQAAVSCYNEKKEPTIHILWQGGFETTGIPESNLRFSDQDKIKIISSNKIGFTLIDTKTQKVLDYTITCTVNQQENAANLKIESKERK
jgi:hypothetical protein